MSAMETDPWQVWGGWEARDPPAQVWTGCLFSAPPPPGSEVRVTNPCLRPSASGGMGVGDLSIPAFTNPWVARLPV